MIALGFDTPDIFWLAPLAAAPLAFSPLRIRKTAAIAAVPEDRLSAAIAVVLRIAGCAAIAALLVGVAGPYRTGALVDHIGEGAEIVFLIDRSASMNENFAGRAPSGDEQSKARAATQVLRDFVAGPRKDLAGVVGFSTSPMLVVPITDRREAIQAAFAAAARPGLDHTNIGRGLAMALAMFRADESGRSRALVLVSDGAAVIDPHLQTDLRADFKKAGVRLYWLFLRTEGNARLHDIPESGADTPQAAPERHLDLFFQSLGQPYRAFEAESPEQVHAAVEQIDRLERRPVLFTEIAPRQDLSTPVFTLAVLAILVLTLAKLAEIPAPVRRGGAS
ncbi:VWA domain-containing protein [Rhodoblastus sphagnicola]|uniref:VWA domain-containing protein n=1 Tax=Rhodoblastus sphagnicola TaxID=333368 RepID=A0A2S6NEB3_9HYPH|nr:vWA domain-containing protein [Rhodoblastus sphagnicola]MBB4200161.1 mxaC protein [Rhodoblastus sphagnicola]PPQ32995.1 VWA domain-containing protein [Rhodoblastus sphagnicola]